MSEQLPVLSQAAQAFIVEAKQHGYGTPGADVRPTESGAKEIHYRKDPFWYVILAER